MSFQPKENFNEWRLIYFISFLLLVGFFVLNMFVGVVVENFHRCRAEQEKEERARRAAKRAKKIEERRRSEYKLQCSLILSTSFWKIQLMLLFIFWPDPGVYLFIGSGTSLTCTTGAIFNRISHMLLAILRRRISLEKSSTEISFWKTLLAAWPEVATFQLAFFCLLSTDSRIRSPTDSSTHGWTHTVGQQTLPCWKH